MDLLLVPRNEFGARFRGWKLPRELSEDFGPDHRGVNPFTNEPVFFPGRRYPLGPEPVADRDAIHHPRVDDLPALPLPDDIYTETLDMLAMVACGWTAKYAAGEISGRYLEGGENRNDWFEWIRSRVVHAIAALADDALASKSEAWAAGCDVPLEVASTWLPRIRAFCRQAGSEAFVFVWGTR